MKTVLIVDDSRTTRNYHSELVSGAGYRVITAVDGANALEKLFAEPCDLVMTDINMPGMDGYELIRRVRENPAFEDVPIVIVTTESRESERLKGLKAGANLHIVKPCVPEELVAQVHAMLADGA